MPGRLAAPAAAFSEALDAMIHAVNRRPASQAAAAAFRIAGITGEGAPEVIRDLIEIAGAFDGMAPPDGIREMLERTALLSAADRFEPEADSLNLITLHQAKGLEFEAVFMPGMEDGILPHYRSLKSRKELEEERRLCFVGITRAKRRLYMSWCARRQNAAGQWTGASPSRFLSEIPLEAAPKRNPPDHGLKRGDPVWHPAFGQGTIINAAGGREAARFTIRFNRSGVKTLPVRLPYRNPKKQKKPD